jgi:hypothetical protein
MRRCLRRREALRRIGQAETLPCRVSVTSVEATKHKKAGNKEACLI